MICGVPGVAGCTLANSVLNRPIVSLASVNLSLSTDISDLTLPFTSIMLSRVFEIFSSTAKKIKFKLVFIHTKTKIIHSKCYSQSVSCSAGPVDALAFFRQCCIICVGSWNTISSYDSDTSPCLLSCGRISPSTTGDWNNFNM